MRRATISILLEIDDVEYEVDCSYHPGTYPSFDYPGDGPEIDTPRFVALLGAYGHPAGYLPWDVLVLYYASEHARQGAPAAPLSAHEDRLVDHLLDRCNDKFNYED